MIMLSVAEGVCHSTVAGSFLTLLCVSGLREGPPLPSDPDFFSEGFPCFCFCLEQCQVPVVVRRGRENG